eukprot:3938417-Rhodomonas_salina.2
MAALMRLLTSGVASERVMAALMRLAIVACRAASSSRMSCSVPAATPILPATPTPVTPYPPPAAHYPQQAQCMCWCVCARARAWRWCGGVERDGDR